MKFLKRLIPFILAIALYDLALFPGWLTPPSFKYSAEVQYSNELNSVEATYYRRGRLLKTGQTTSYVDYDDGYYEKGIAKSYTVLTTGDFAGTKNIDLTHLVSIKIAFVKATPNDSITSTTVNFTTLFVAGDVIVFSGSSAGGNNTNRTIAAGGVAAGTITLTSDNQQTSVGEDIDTITIKKREAHSNACVLDNNTGLMWSQTVSGKMGPASDGKMPWTTHANGYGIYPYVVAANTALLGGYGDWRIANLFELINIIVYVADGAVKPNGTAFPGFPGGDYIWSSTTSPTSTTKVIAFLPVDGTLTENLKTNSYQTLLVRGG